MVMRRQLADRAMKKTVCDRKQYLRINWEENVSLETLGKRSYSAVYCKRSWEFCWKLRKDIC